MNDQEVNDAKRHEPPAAWNDTVAAYPADTCLHQLFEAQAARAPDAIAAIFGDEHLTYVELNRRANQLAHHLMARGIGPDVVTAISMERSLEMIIAVLGVLKAGGAYAPLDPHYPTDRLAFMLADSQAPVLLTQHHLLDNLPSHDGATLCLDTDWPVIRRENADNPAGPVQPDNLTYVIYTSGSTGKPKGVALEHRPLVNLMAWQFNQSALAEGARTLQFASLSFDVSCQEIFATLGTGGTLVLITEAIRRDSTQLLRTIVENDVARLFLPFVALQGLAETAVSTGMFPPSLREVITAGEQLQVNRFIEGFFAGIPNCRLTNQYGPSETHVVTAFDLPPAVSEWSPLPPIGRPVANVQTYIVNEALQPVPIGEVGELCLGGIALARGYLHRSDLTAQKFIAGPFGPGRIYKTGDLARYLPDGNIEFLGRIDHQIKIRGFRVELGEIETALAAHPAVRQAVVVAHQDEPGDKRLVAYMTIDTETAPDATELRRFLLSKLPDYMVPALFIDVPVMPKTPSGKVDRKALPVPSRRRPQLEQAYVAPKTDAERRLAAVWADVLKVDRVGLNDNFFELGGDSLLAHRIAIRVQQEFGLPDLAVVKLFQYATIGGLARYLSQGDSARRLHQKLEAPRRTPGESGGVAIVGMAGRFPGAASPDQLWQNLCDGVESVTFFDEDELAPSVAPYERQHRNYVRARGIVADADKFDAPFFGINPREAELMDPQQRVFLEVAWAALENAGYAPGCFDGTVGVYAGVGNNTYYHHNVLTHPKLVERVGEFQVMTANEKDYVATRTAYKLNLTGPAISLYTACSTSLVAVSHAFFSLENHQCDMALAGGASITVPQNAGYLYQEGGMFSADGHTRSFDAGSTGTVFGNGVGVVVLKRLDDALANGDRIYAVIHGAAVNNDGASRVSFAAPGVEGQAEVIAMAQAYAGFHPETISYVETHGTATPLGDPIEIEALTQAFRAKTEAKQFCAIGSAKSNLGHTIAAAGVTGLIKTALALYHQILPPSLFFESPNPNIDFANSPFFVNARLTDWPSNGEPRRAGVSAFGVGGTNAHVVLEEAPVAEPSTAGRPVHLLPLSAKTEAALNRATANLAAHLTDNPGINLADAAFTLQTGRQAFNHRRFVVARQADDAASVLESLSPKQTGTRVTEIRDPELVFMFPGQGAQYVNMGLNLYQGEPVFRQAMDQCADILAPHLGRDIRDTLYPAPGRVDAAADDLRNTFFTQPALFSLGYALAQLWQSWGVRPQVMLGHSIGEFVAACLAGVFSLEDGLMLIAARGRLMQDLPAGAMLSVKLPAAKLEPRLGADVALAAINGPSLCVAAGSPDAIAELQKSLKADRVASQSLKTSHAFHSAMMEPVIEPFRQLVAGILLSAPKIPIVSTVTGDWLSAEQATDPAYWAGHLRATVRFSEAVQTVWQEPGRVLLEVGPGVGLTTLARQHARDKAAQLAVPSLDSTATDHAEWTAILKAAGRLWLGGVSIDWAAMHARERRHRLPLPTYPFERKRYWLEPAHIKPPQSVPQFATEGKIQIMTEPVENQSGRYQKLVPMLQTLIEDMSGFEVADAAPDVTFMEIGLDSLTLTQLALALQREFRVDIAFRQLMEDVSSVGALARYLDAAMPPDALAQAEPPAAAPPPPQSAPAMPAPVSPLLAVAASPLSAPIAPVEAAPGTVEQLIAQQIQVMAMQLQVLGRAGTVSAPPTPSRPAPKAEKPAKPQAFGAGARIKTEKDDSLTAVQVENLQNFIRKYNARTGKSKAYTQAHRPHLADPRVVSSFNPLLKEMVYPIVVSRSSGSTLWDLDGNKYVDLTSGFGSNFFGFSPPFINKALAEQMERGVDIGPQTPLAGEVAQLITDFTGLDRVAFCNTGSEAVLGAMRLARTVRGRNLIAIFSGAYHGIFNEVIVRGTKKLRSMAAAPGIPPEAVQNVLVLDYDDPQSLQILRERADDLAAVMVEPVQSRRPDLQPGEFLRQLRQFTQQEGIAFIVDEVITGFRTHPGGAQAIFGVKADIATYGKVVGAGMPIGVIAGQSKFMDALDGGQWQFGDDSFPQVGVTYFAGTFVRHPLAMAAAKAALEFLKAGGPSIQRNLNLRTTNMVMALNDFFQQAEVGIEIKHFGSLFKVNYAPDLPFGELLFYWLRHKGIHIWDHRPCFLTLTHTDEDIAFVIDAFKQSIGEMQAAGFLPQPANTLATTAARPPVPGARLGKDPKGMPTWYIPDPDRPGKYMKMEEVS